MIELGKKSHHAATTSDMTSKTRYTYDAVGRYFCKDVGCGSVPRLLVVLQLYVCTYANQVSRFKDKAKSATIGRRISGV